MTLALAADWLQSWCQDDGCLRCLLTVVIVLQLGFSRDDCDCHISYPSCCTTSCIPVSCDREMTLARCWTPETLLRHSDISWHLIILIRLRSFLMPWSVERVASPVTRAPGRRLGCQIMARIWFLMGRWCKRRGRSATLRIYIYTDKSHNFNEDTGVWSPLDFARQGFHQEVKTQGFNI